MFTLVTVLGITAASAQTQEKITTTTDTKIENPMDPTATQEARIATTTTKSTTVKRKPAVRKRTVSTKRTTRSTPVKAVIQTKVVVPAN